MRVLNEEDKSARDKVKKMIEDYRSELESYAKAGEDDNDPVLLEGETSTGYCVQLFVDPREIVPILLKYDYPTYSVLDEDYPEGMWEDLGRKFGLDSIISVDL